MISHDNSQYINIINVKKIHCYEVNDDNKQNDDGVTRCCLDI